MAKKRAESSSDHLDTIDDGTIPVKIQGGESDGKTVQLDLMLAKIAFEEVEIKHKVYETKGPDGKSNWKATTAFLADAAKAMQSVGVPNCTGTMAYQLWSIVSQRWIDLKKNTREVPR